MLSEQPPCKERWSEPPVATTAFSTAEVHTIASGALKNGGSPEVVEHAVAVAGSMSAGCSALAAARKGEQAVFEMRKRQRTDPRGRPFVSKAQQRAGKRRAAQAMAALRQEESRQAVDTAVALYM